MAQPVKNPPANAGESESESEVAQSCPTLRPHGLQPIRLLHPWIFQATVLQWDAIAFSDILASLPQ